jgi:hypothetical protein
MFWATFWANFSQIHLATLPSTSMYVCRHRVNGEKKKKLFVGRSQGDQIGRIFAYWVTVCYVWVVL